MTTSDQAERHAYAIARVAKLERHLASFPDEGLGPRKAKERRDLAEALTRWRGVLAECEREGAAA